VLKNLFKKDEKKFYVPRTIIKLIDNHVQHVYIYNNFLGPRSSIILWICYGNYPSNSTRNSL